MQTSGSGQPTAQTCVLLPSSPGDNGRGAGDQKSRIRELGKEGREQDPGKHAGRNQVTAFRSREGRIIWGRCTLLAPDGASKKNGPGDRTADFDSILFQKIKAIHDQDGCFVKLLSPLP